MLHINELLIISGEHLYKLMLLQILILHLTQFSADLSHQPRAVYGLLVRILFSCLKRKHKLLLGKMNIGFSVQIVANIACLELVPSS